MSGADVAQRNGYTGAGIKVAVIDSGTDYDHPDLGVVRQHACAPARLQISPDSLAVGFSPASGAPLPPGSGTLPVRRTGTLASSADGCSSTVPAAPPPPGSVEGAAALIRHGGCGFYEKAINAQAAGAVAVVLSNNAPGQLNAAVTPRPTRRGSLPSPSRSRTSTTSRIASA